MSGQEIQPHRVTKPMQLLAAWLVGLTVIDGSFLGAAVAIGASMERTVLVWAAILNVPVFLVALFILQTRFRAELQEDSFFFQYISQKTAAVVSLNRANAQSARIEALENELERLRKNALQQEETSSSLNWSAWTIALNDHRSDFPDIRAALKEAGMDVSEVFGKIYGTKKPDRWIISINAAMDMLHVKALLTVLLRFNFDGFRRFDRIPEGPDKEDVFIGSYSDSPYTPITAGFLDMLASDNFDAVALQYFMSKNTEKIPR